MCPAFKSKDSVLERPNDEIAGPQTVCPGLHAFDGGYSVVWWDPGALELGARPPFGVRREELIVKDVPRHVVADGRAKYDRWRSSRDEARRSAAVPMLEVQTVGEWAREETTETEALVQDSPVDPTQVAVLDVRPTSAAADMDRPGGPMFGTLVHSILAQAPLDASRELLNEVAAMEARLIDAPADAVARAVAAAERVLGHDLLQRARQAATLGRCRRETTVTIALDGRLIEGVVDLAFEEDDQWVVVDYKTDRELALSGELRYRRQVALYASAIARASGRPARAVLVRI
jgi:ATP-dependent exoDNAse (exonuclease V) beta subunit